MENRFDVVVSILPLSDDPQGEVDFRVGFDHGCSDNTGKAGEMQSSTPDHHFSVPPLFCPPFFKGNAPLIFLSPFFQGGRPPSCGGGGVSSIHGAALFHAQNSP